MTAPNALDTAEQDALRDALDDEYKSHETYAQVIRDFGPQRPFINIVEAEARHIAVLLRLFDQYAIPKPINRWAGQAPRYASIAEACNASAQGEAENGTLYDRLLQSTRRVDILHVYHALRAASLDRHLPAFERCVARGRSRA
ncbi:MAG: DUF2202 domain-containing protein [Aquimonas sp.]|nr:DUF2202 domain-containing protein [Aquimonas sp.]